MTNLIANLITYTIIGIIIIAVIAIIISIIIALGPLWILAIIAGLILINLIK